MGISRLTYRRKHIYTMASIKDSKILVSILGIILFGIWGEIGYQLIWGGSSSEDTTTGMSASTDGIKREQSFTFSPNVRDPFSYRPEIRVSKKVAKPALKIWVPPPFKLQGVILKSHKRTAIIESLDGKTFFVSPGDTLCGVKVLSIDNQKVRYRFMRKDTSWAVGR